MTRLLLPVLVTSLVLSGSPGFAHGRVVSTESSLVAAQRAASVQRVSSFLLQQRVRAELVRLGVDPDAALERVGALTTSELMDLDHRINKMPAGGILEVIGIVAVVLIILELTGVTNIFTKI